MPNHSHTSIFTTVSDVVGGLGKAVSAKPLLMAITLPGLTTVVLYNAASDAAGYLVKKALDKVSAKLNKYFNENFGAMKKVLGFAIGAGLVYGMVQTAENAVCI